MSISELPTELVLEIASYMDFDESTPTHLAMTSHHFYGILMSLVLDYEADHIRNHLIEADAGTRRAPVLRLEGVDKNGHDVEKIGSHSALLQPFGGEYKLVCCQLRGSEMDLRCIRGVIVRAALLECVDLCVNERSSLQALAALINVCVGQANLALTISGSFKRDIDSGSGPFWYQKQDQPENPPTGPLHVGQIPQNASKLVRRIIPSLSDLGHRILQKISIKRNFHQHEKTTPAITTPPRSKIVLLTILRVPAIALSLAPEPQISTLNIRSDAPFLPSLYPLTLKLLNHAPITTLILGWSLSVDRLDWHSILLSIKMPLLSHLEMIGQDVGSSDLLFFLRRHQSIEILRLIIRQASSHIFDSGPPTFPEKSDLPHLWFLRATSKYLLPFLKHREEGNFSSLRHVFLENTDRDDVLEYPPQTLDRYPLGRIYDILFSRSSCRRISAITFSSLRESGFVEWYILASETWPTPRQIPDITSITINSFLSIFEQSTATLRTWMDQNYPLWDTNCSARDDDSEADIRLLKAFFSSIFPQLTKLEWRDGCMGP